MAATVEPVEDQAAEEFVGRVFDAVLGALDTWAIYVGDKLGLYDALAGSKTMTQEELVAETGMNWRYAQEWLEHQVTAGVIEVDDPQVAPESRAYSLPPAHREVLCDRDSLNFLAPFVRLVTAGGIQLPSLLEAYRGGGGVSWQQYGEDMRTGQAEMNRPWFLSALGSEWFPEVERLHAKLQQKDVTVADIGCGEGWSTIAIAKAYPGLTIDGYDVDEASIIAAREHAAAESVSDRVTFHHTDGSRIPEDKSYDVVTFFECIHDMPDPVGVLESARRLVKEDGQVVVMDEAVGSRFGDRNDEVERLMYGFSLFVCLPDGMSHEGSVGTGTVMRPDRLGEYAMAAGFAGVDVLPIENDLWRFYELSL